MSPVFSVLAQELSQTEQEESAPGEYVNPVDDQAAQYLPLMREISEFKKSVQGALNEQEQQEALELYQRISSYRDQEYERLGEKGLSQYKRNQFDAVLEDVQQSLEPYIPAEERPAGFFGFFTDSAEPFAPLEPTTPPDLAVPENPGGFEFADEPIEIKNVEILEDAFDVPSTSDDPLIKRVSQFVVPQVKAQTTGQNLPVLADLQADDEEVIIDASIKKLAQDLNNNPVEILNFVRNRIHYEPYFGAKKGNLGCLEERVCNDVDGSSLLISLLRAAGIPAQYKKTPVMMPVEQLQNLLGVDTTKAGFAALAWNKVPVYTVNSTVSGSFEASDFSNETHIVLQWVHVEAYVNYDEIGGNSISLLHPEDYSNDQELQEAFSEQENMLWLSLDPLIRSYKRTINPVLADDATFDIPGFWQNFFSRSTVLSPIAQYAADLQSITGHDVLTDNYQSLREGEETRFDILPPALPYTALGSVSSDDGIISSESWKVLPQQYRFQIRLSIVNENDTPLFQKQFYGSEVNNLPLELSYKGATQADEDVIAQYGGIHATPSSLVSIVPVLNSEREQYLGTGIVASIGDRLTLRFEIGYNNQVDHSSEKFSIAGNSEGIYMVTSRVTDDTLLSNNSQILLEGNAALAREYLKRVFEADTIAQSLDHSWNMGFARAVVTQNRVLSEVNGNPTTFTFKGLTIDSSTYINNYSNRGAYDHHLVDFRLLFGLEASYQEAQFFSDIAGLDAVATVNGLQYASERPAEYILYTIDANNQSLVDSLNLSENTKQNMRADIQDGRTIITPQKAISIENFTGILYVSYDPLTGEGRYAIGEQTQQNGGFITETFSVVAECPQGATVCSATHRVITKNLSDYMIFAEGAPFNGDAMCLIDRSIYNELISRSGYDIATQGVPCYRETRYFDLKAQSTTTATPTEREAQNSYTFTVYTFGTHFYKPGEYDEWVGIREALAVLTYDFLNHPAMLGNNPIGSIFKFNLSAGTYSLHGRYDLLVRSPYVTTYYQPTPAHSREKGTTSISLPFFGTTTVNKGNGRVVYNHAISPSNSPVNFLTELGKTNPYLSEEDQTTPEDCPDYEVACYKRDWLVRVLGFPTSDLQSSSEGVWQNFIGGMMYGKDSYYTFYVPNPIYQFYQNNGGMSGSIGFPEGNPQISLDGLSFFQSFENAYDLKLSTSNLSVTQVPKKSFRCEIYGDYQSDFLKTLALAIGFIDGAATLIEDTGQLIADILSYLYNDYNQIPSDLYDVIQTLSSLDLATVKKIIQIIYSVAEQAAFDAINSELLNPNTCSIRKSYLTGLLIAGLAEFASPKKAGNAAKIGVVANRVNILTRLVKNFPDLNVQKLRIFIEKISKLGQRSLKRLAEDNRLMNLLVKNDFFSDGLSFSDVQFSSIDFEAVNDVTQINDYFRNVKNKLPPYSGNNVIHMATTRVFNNVEFVRVHTTNQAGTFITTAETLKKLKSIDNITDKLGLPSPPTHISAVDIPAGTELRYGIIAPQKADGSIFTRDVAGGAEQFEILLERVPNEWFRNPIITDPTNSDYVKGALLQDWLNIN